MFNKLAATITKNAPRYKTKLACDLAMGRVRAAYSKAGSYGNEYHLLSSAVAALQYRWQELDGIEIDARTAAAS